MDDAHPSAQGPAGQGLRPRVKAGQTANVLRKSTQSIPSAKHGGLKQMLLMLSFGFFFVLSAIAIHGTQMVGAPLYVIHRPSYYTYMAFTKRMFGVLMNTITQWFAPTVVRVSASQDVAKQMKLGPHGTLETTFPSRLILIANHQIYTDWAYLWWISYTSHMHGHIYIILKQSVKYLPIIGPGMMFYGFIFLARKWATDRPRFEHRLAKLDTDRNDPRTGSDLDPMWLLIFPEGTNLSKNGRSTSKRFAEKTGVPDMQHQLLPRSTGLGFCLQKLQGSVEWVYDCTIAYEGVPRSEYAQDVLPLQGIYFQGRAPQSVNMHWRRFRTSDIPVQNAVAFDMWLQQRWREKDDMLEQYAQTGRLPPNPTDEKLPLYFETEVKSRHTLEFLLIFAPIITIVGAAILLDATCSRLWSQGALW